MSEYGDRMLWGALLSQAKANLSQACANEEFSRALHTRTQCMACRESVYELEPDRIESWYAADSDAEAGASIAEHLARQAEWIWQEVQGKADTSQYPHSAGKDNGQKPRSATVEAVVSVTQKRSRRLL